MNSQNTQTKSAENSANESFLDEVVKVLVEDHNVDEELANNMISFYMKNFDSQTATAQHLGPDYFAVQILQEENLI